MKLQKTFNGNNADDDAIAWLSNLAKCFHIKKAVITEMKQQYDWKGKKIRLVVRYV